MSEKYLDKEGLIKLNELIHKDIQKVQNSVDSIKNTIITPKLEVNPTDGCLYMIIEE